MLTVEDTMVNRDKTNELKRVLEKVFNERCGLPVEVAFQYIPPKENDRRKQIELKLEREAQAIYWQNHKDELENASGGENISQTVAKSDNGEKKTHNSNAAIMDIPMPEAAPWDALMDQAASGNVPGNDETISPVSDGIKPVDAGKTAAAKPQSGGKMENLSLTKAEKAGEEIKTPALEKTGSFLLNVPIIRMYFTAVILKMTLWRLRRSTERSEKLPYVDRS